MRITRLMLTALVFGALVLACTPGNLSSETPGSAEALIRALRAQGLEPQTGGTIEQEFFSVSGQVIKIENATIQIFEYADREARSTHSALISEHGSSIGTTMVTWIDTPHFWAQDRIIVLYVGSNQSIVDALTQILGQPLATGAGTAASEQP
ncbi:MAG: hypothetical protein R3191_01145 [Anaerolineales bacterium]|nr:hypothetical protein [Anaerolineales bacterium]